MALMPVVAKARRRSYVCPMLTRSQRDGAGHCPICGMKLASLRRSGRSATAPAHAAHGDHEPGDGLEWKT